MSAPQLNRKLHRLGAILFALPIAVICGSGILLQLKKDWAWVQPTTLRGSTVELAIGWDEILEVARGVPEAGIESWDDVNRLDVRPGRGIVKVRCRNGWELQLDTRTGEVLGSTERRSDLIESIHDGSWFHDRVKLWVFLPTAVVLCGLWGTGVYLWLLPYLVKRRRKNVPSKG